MSTVLAERCPPVTWPRRWGPWLAVLAALALLYVPTYIALAHGPWRDEEYAHGPLVLAIFALLVWRDRAALVAGARARAPVAGTLLLVSGLVLYMAGRTLGIALFEVGSQLPVLAGVLLATRGWNGVRRFGFALVFLAFMVPMPGFVLAAASAPLKEFVSAAVAFLLSALGYPVMREGVTLTVGSHEMLVADACAGMASLTSLAAIVLLYAHLTGRALRVRAALLLAAVVPVAIASNVLRVLVLALVAYHYGDDAAQGAVHQAAGIAVFVAALAMVVGLDRVVYGRRRVQLSKRPPRTPRSGARLAPRAALFAWIAALGMAGSALAAPVLAPQVVTKPGFELARLLPERFGDWRIDADVMPVAPAPDVQAKLDRLYGQVLSRTYVNAAGEHMMLVVAYGGDQSDALKVHRQEACYSAQGFEIASLAHGTLASEGRAIPVTRMLAVRGERSEPVTYWFTMGDRVVLGRIERLRVQLAEGIHGRVPDGMLVRVSSLSGDAPSAYAAQAAFVGALLSAVPESFAARLAGARAG
jgi:exosortase B